MQQKHAITPRIFTILTVATVALFSTMLARAEPATPPGFTEIVNNSPTDKCTATFDAVNSTDQPVIYKFYANASCTLNANPKASCLTILKVDGKKVCSAPTGGSTGGAVVWAWCPAQPKPRADQLEPYTVTVPAGGTTKVDVSMDNTEASCNEARLGWMKVTPPPPPPPAPKKS